MGGFEGVRKRTVEQARIVITLEVEYPREDWHKYAAITAVSDAVDCARIDVDTLTMDEMFDKGISYTIVAAK